MIPAEHYAETYTKEAVAELCQMAGVEPEDTEYVRQELEHFAAIYRQQHKAIVSKTPGKATTRELDTVAKQAARLLATLERLSPKAASAIEARGDADTRRGLSHAPSDTRARPSLFLPIQDVAEDLSGVTVDIVTLRSVIGGLHHAAENAAKEIPNSRSSKPKDLGLLLWLSNMEHLWGQLTSQPYSRDVGPNGEPLTNAGRFCFAAFRMIEPNCAPSRVMNGMKTRSNRRRNSTGNLRA
ncbi:hypothetical protein [Roseovarius aquimarinus]|uniref:Uncharacterized protein n=1 Tax=Roseovarius aquimarinus TaxID=1229156 RepID=A0ABW7IBL5_9RHOB